MLAVDIEPGIDVVVVNYHTLGDLLRFTDSFAESNLDSLNANLIVVDVDATPENGYYDLAKEALAHRYNFPFQYWPVVDNCGYGAACNFGAMCSSSDVIGLFNADTFLYSDTLKKCYDALMQNRDWGALGPLQVNSVGRVTHAGIFGTNEKPQHRAWQQPISQAFRDVREAVTISGSAYFVKRSIWETLTEDPVWQALFPDISGAMPTFPHYYDDELLSFRIRKAGYKVMYFGEAMMCHEWHRASPVGGVAEKVYMPDSLKRFRHACDVLGIAHE